MIEELSRSLASSSNVVLSFDTVLLAVLVTFFAVVALGARRGDTAVLIMVGAVALFLVR